jgi:hypothetical protein
VYRLTLAAGLTLLGAPSLALAGRIGYPLVFTAAAATFSASTGQTCSP